MYHRLLQIIITLLGYTTPELILPNFFFFFFGSPYLNFFHSPSITCSNHYTTLIFYEINFLVSTNNQEYNDIVFVCAWLISLNMISFSFIHLGTNDRILFFFLCLNNTALCIYTTLSTLKLMDTLVIPSIS